MEKKLLSFIHTEKFLSLAGKILVGLSFYLGMLMLMFGGALSQDDIAEKLFFIFLGIQIFMGLGLSGKREIFIHFMIPFSLFAIWVYFVNGFSNIAIFYVCLFVIALRHILIKKPI